MPRTSSKPSCSHSRTRHTVSADTYIAVHDAIPAWASRVHGSTHPSPFPTLVPLVVPERLPDAPHAPAHPPAAPSPIIPDVAESIGRELLVYGRRLPKAELFARIDAVDSNTVRAVADRFIYDQVRTRWQQQGASNGYGGVLPTSTLAFLHPGLPFRVPTFKPSFPRCIQAHLSPVPDARFPQDMAVAAVGDPQFMPDYNWFRKR